MRGTLSFSERVEWDSNPDLVANPGSGAFVSRTGLGFSLKSETRTEVLDFSLGAQIEGRIAGNASDGFDLKRQNAALNYRREGATSALTFSGRHTETRLADEVIAVDGGFFGISFGEDVLVISSGSVTTDSVGVRVETGTGTPLELRFGTAYSRTDFQGTSDPDLVDKERLNADALARFHLNRALTLRTSLKYTRTEETGSGTTTTDTSIGFGAETETAGGLSLTGEVFLDKSKTGAATDDGVGLSVGVEQARADGAWGLDLASRIDQSGRRTSAVVRRNFDLPDGALGFSLGVFDQEGDDSLRLSGGVDYSRDTPRGGITASLSRRPGSSGGSAYANTQIGLAYREAINEVSGWSAGVSYAAKDELGGSNDSSRASANLTYVHELGDDWNMRAGVEHTRFNEAGSADRSRNRVFFTVGRDISFGF